MKQLSLLAIPNAGKIFVPTQGQRKNRRPLCSKRPLHLILKSTRFDLKKNEKHIRQTWFRMSKKFGIKIYRLAICSNHIHAAIKIHSQSLYNSFIQAFTGSIAKVLKIKWLNRPITRIVSWGKEFRRVCTYVQLNFLEAERHLDYQAERTRRLPDWLKL